MVSSQVRSLAHKAQGSLPKDVSRITSFFPITQSSLLHAADKSSSGSNPLCAFSLFAALDMLKQYIHEANDSETGALTMNRCKRLRHRHPKLVAALCAFVCTPRTREELVKLDDEMSECNCKYAGASDHSRKLADLHAYMHISSPENMDPFNAVIGSALGILSLVVFTIKPGSLENPTLDSQSMAHDAVSYFFVQQINETINAIATWFEYTRCSMIMISLAIFLRQLTSFKASLAKSGAFLGPIAQELGKLVSTLKIAQKLSDYEKTQLVNLSHFFSTLFCPLPGPLLPEWFSKDGHGHAIYDHYYFLMHQDIYRSSSLGDKYSKEDPDEMMKKIALCIRDMLPESEFSGPRPQVKNIGFDYSTLQGIGVQIPRILRYLRETSSSCYYPLCESNHPDAPPLKNCPLPRCKGCSVMSYCSSKCQRLAWDFEEKPHKLVCATIKRFYDAWKFFDDNYHTIPDVDFMQRLFSQEGFHANYTAMPNPDEVLKAMQFRAELTRCRLELLNICGWVMSSKSGHTVEEMVKSMVSFGRYPIPTELKLWKPEPLDVN